MYVVSFVHISVLECITLLRWLMMLVPGLESRSQPARSFRGGRKFLAPVHFGDLELDCMTRLGIAYLAGHLDMVHARALDTLFFGSPAPLVQYQRCHHPEPVSSVWK